MAEPTKHMAIKLGVAAACLVVGVVGFVMLSASDDQPTREFSRARWYYDLATREAFEHTPRDGELEPLPPINTPDGSVVDGVPAGVRLHVFACGGCDDPSQQFHGYLETVSAAERNRVENLPPGLRQAQPAGTQIAAVPESADAAIEWYAGDTPEAAAVRDKVETRCMAAKAVECQP